MRSEQQFPQLFSLSADQRLQLAEDLWDSVASEMNASPLPEAQRQVIEQRLAAYEADGQAGDTWDRVKRRVQGTDG